MNPLLSALLRSWEWRADVILVLVLAGVLYTRGWRRLRHLRQGRGRNRPGLAAGWRLAAYQGGLAVLALALLSPIDVLGSQLFFMHMIQHLLLVMAAPPLLLLANPLPFFLWGLPGRARFWLGRLLSRRSAFRRNLRALTRPGLTWMVFIAVFLGWHDPNAYNAALRSEWVHDLEHITFFGTALLYWWHVTGAGPRIHGRFVRGARLAYVLATVPVNMLTGVAIAFSRQPIYSYYTTVPRFWGLTVMQDQTLGGVIMWIPGSMMYLIAAIILIARLFRVERSRPLPKPTRAADAATNPPGWENS